MMQMQKKLETIFEHQVFELCGPFATETGNDYYVPYMMNDALEDYLILKNGRMVGEYLHDTELEQQMQLAEDENGFVLAVRQGEENAFTLYFERIEESVEFYQYHEIGHFWVKGQEQWRQLVYIIGTINDKYQFSGKDSCNEAELEILPLMEFAPFRYWSPIHESLSDWYPDTYGGVELAKKLAKEAGDKSLYRWICLYEKFPREALSKWIGKMLLHPRRESFYEVIWKRVEAASQGYPKRTYSKDIAAEIEQIRENVQKELGKRGFEGTYPVYTKEDTQIRVMEEHPFTIMEWDHYKFRVQFMVSKCKNQKRNSGFFKGPGRKGWIETYESI